jgi:hypothetical protein
MEKPSKKYVDRLTANANDFDTIVMDMLNEIDELDKWKEAVIEECITSCFPWYEKDSVKSVNNLINWEVEMSLDPKISSDAQDLVDSNFRKLEKANFEPKLVMPIWVQNDLMFRDFTVDFQSWDNLIENVNKMEKSDGKL